MRMLLALGGLVLVALVGATVWFWVGAPSPVGVDPEAPAVADSEVVQLSGADLTGANLDGFDLRKVRLEHTKLHGASLRGAVLVGAPMKGADLSGADLRGANLTSADLSGADLSRACLLGAVLIDARFGGAVVAEAVFEKDAFASARVPPPSTATPTGSASYGRDVIEGTPSTPSSCN